MRKCSRGHKLTGTGDRRGCDECRRENLLRRPPKGPKPLAATSPRQNRRRSTSFLSRRQILAAHELYVAGWNTEQLAEAGWRKWGYRSKEKAAAALRRGFRLDGLEVRSREDSLFLKAGTCSACGIEKDERTTGCETCANRHFKRRQSGRPFKSGRKYEWATQETPGSAEAEAEGMKEAA